MAAPRTFSHLLHANVTLPMDLERHIAQGGGEREAVIRVGLGLGLGLGFGFWVRVRVRDGVRVRLG